MLELYSYFRSSAAYRVRIALAHKQLQWAQLPVNLLQSEQQGAEYLELNPQGLVPALQTDQHLLTQSLAILDYLDNTRGLKLLPGDPGDRARAMALAHAIAVDIHPVCNLSVAAEADKMSGGRDGARQAWMQRFIRPGLIAFETLLAGFDQAPYCCGDTPGLADICLMPQLYNAHRWEVDITDLPRCLTVETSCAAHPAFAAAHPDQVKPA